MFENLFEEMPAARSCSATYPALNTWEDGENLFVPKAEQARTRKIQIS